MNRTKGIRWQRFALNIPCIGVFYRIVVILALFVLGGGFNCPPVEAVQQQGGGHLPAYLKQLEAYRNQTLEHFSLEEQQQERSRRLRESVQLHTIRRGETLGEIARIYAVELAALAYWNNISNPNRIRAGEVLHVLTVNGTLHHVEEGDTLTAVASRYNVDREKISDFNLLEGSGLLQAGNKLVIPGSTTLTGTTEKEMSVLALASRGGIQSPAFRWPLRGTITSYFGMREGGFHHGLDIAAPYGSEVRAAASGVVEYTGIQGGYGLMLILDHGNGWKSLYAHNSRLLVKKGQRVTAGQPISLVGASGNATGPHLHLEIMQYEKKLDPMFYLP